VSEELLNKLADFVQKYLSYKDRDLIKAHILRHNEYHTIYYAIDDKGEIVGFCRWNISPDGKTAFILDMITRPDFRRLGVGRDFLRKGLSLWDKVTHIQFNRGSREDFRQKRIPVGQILKRNIF